MRYSPEALTAFVTAVDCGSFSAAARRLRKSQSTISMAIANLESDLGVVLFDRSARQPVLTEQGQQVLRYVQSILAASERLDALAVSLTEETEPRLSFVLSDTLDPKVLEGLLAGFDRAFPHTEFECLIGENEDVVDLLQKGRADVGLIESREQYPGNIGFNRLPVQTYMGIYVAASHPLAVRQDLTYDSLHSWRELRLNTFLARADNTPRGPVWSAPNYLLLLSMAVQGLGWCALPCALVKEFAGLGSLVQVPLAGWPRSIATDVLWNRQTPPGKAGRWLRDYLMNIPR